MSRRCQNPDLSPVMRGFWSFSSRGSYPNPGPYVALILLHLWPGSHDMWVWVAAGPWLCARTSHSCCLSIHMVWEGRS